MEDKRRGVRLAQKQDRDGQHKAEMRRKLEELEAMAPDIAWHDGYEIKYIILELIAILKKG